MMKHPLLWLAALLLTGCMASGPKHISATAEEINKAPETLSLNVPLIRQYDSYSCSTTSQFLSANR